MLDKLKQAGNLLKEAATDGIDELKNSNLAKKVENAVDDVKEFADETVDSVKEKVGVVAARYTVVYPNTNHDGGPDTLIDYETLEDAFAGIESKTGITIREKAE